MKLYEPITGPIASLDEDGRGIMAGTPRPVKAFFAVPGDVARVKPCKRAKGEIIGNVEEILTPSPDRVPATCPFTGSCGGCMWRMLGYEKELEYKRELVSASLRGAGVDLPLEVIPAKELSYYRNRMDYCIGPNGEVGLKAPGSWFTYLDLTSCFMLSPEATEIMTRFRALLKREGLTSYIPRTGKGFLRYLVIREGKRTGNRLVHIVTTSAGTLPDAAILEAIGPLATHIVHGVNDSQTDLSVAATNRVLKGCESFTEEANGITYTIPLGGFFQTNTVMSEALFETVREFLGAPKRVLDLYCGVGFFALPLAKAGMSVLGVEIDPNAIRAAEIANAANGTTATFRAEKSEELSWAAERPDAVIIDPPRAGLHPKVTKALLAMLPERIIYVSCKYSRFAQELPQFLAHYRIERMRAIDLFPHTPHIELVTSFVRK